jgi:hypothetical protein
LTLSTPSLPKIPSGNVLRVELLAFARRAAHLVEVDRVLDPDVA